MILSTRTINYAIFPSGIGETKGSRALQNIELNYLILAIVFSFTIYAKDCYNLGYIMNIFCSSSDRNLFRLLI